MCEPTAEIRGILNEAKQLLFTAYDKIKGEELMERVQIRVQAVQGDVWRGLDGHQRDDLKEDDQEGTSRRG